MRLMVDLPDDDVRWLDARAKALGVSRAEIIREAIVAYRARCETAAPAESGSGS